MLSPQETESDALRQSSNVRKKPRRKTRGPPGRTPTDHHSPDYAFEGDIQLIAQLPTEVLILIFELGHEGHLTSFSSKVSSVCRYWRYLALSTPCLWSPIMFSGLHVAHLERARLYLERSKSFPVSIWVNCARGYNLTEYWNDLYPNLQRCRSLSISGDGHTIYGDVMRLGSMKMPLLEALEIYNTFPQSRVGGWARRPSQSLFPAANLRTVRMDMFHMQGRDLARCLSLGSVTSFWFSWEISTPDYDVDDPEETTADKHVSYLIEAMPQLRELTLDGGNNSDGYPIPLLHKLPLPLEVLDLTGLSLIWDLKHGDWKRRDFSRLEIFRLVYSSTANHIIDADLFSLLEITPNLRELSVSIELVPESSKVIAPVRLEKLKMLTLDWVVKHTLQTFVQNLTAPALKSVTFLVSSQFDAEPNTYGLDSSIPSFWKYCMLVESLALNNGCTLSSNTTLLAALRDILKNLKSLDLQGHSAWNDELLKGLGTRPWLCPSLEKVSFSYMPRLTQGALEHFVQARKRGSVAGECAAITKIAMRGCGGLSATKTLENIVDEVLHRI